MRPQPSDIALAGPLIVGLGVTIVTILNRALAFSTIINFVRYQFLQGRAGASFWKDVAIVALSTIVALADHLIDIVIWAIAFMLCKEFASFAAAMLYSGECYTTLGSPMVTSDNWKLLAQLEAADGLLMFGLSTALLFAVIQRMVQARLEQDSGRGNR